MTNLLKKRPIAVVFCVTFLMYSPLLFNHYVGDDNIVMGRNTFYHSWRNLPRIFGPGAVADTHAIHYNTDLLFDFGTGKDQYRPISDVTYFLDAQLFSAKPWGSHFVNILIHCVNAVLVCLIVTKLFSVPFLGIAAGLLFSLHPLQSEPVAVMSYRADILAAMFVLCAFYAWIRFSRSGYLKQRHYYASLVMYGLAVFSKESACLLPLVIIVFDQIMGIPRPGSRPRAAAYGGFVLIFLLFLYLYFIVFPTPLAAAGAFHWLGGSLLNHVFLMGYIWQNYLVNVSAPWTVKMIPGHYCPPLSVLTAAAAAWIAICFMALMACFILLWRRYKECVFFIWWYVVFYIPLSNSVPIANPMANRYMYLPSIGLLIVAAFFLNKLFGCDCIRKYAGRLSDKLYVCVLGVCIVLTLFLNGDWKSNYHVASAWVRDYPADGQGYALLGREYLGTGDVSKALENLEKSVLLGSYVPGDLLALAACYVRQERWTDAEYLLKQIVRRYPGYAEPLFCLGTVYYKQKRMLQAREALEQALVLNPKKSSGYVLLMNIYQKLHQAEDVEALLKKAEVYLSLKNVTGLRRMSMPAERQDQFSEHDDY
ncbi:MAG: tetratricopeptide repeat protein [Candidatus Omnitrophota bacterium]